MWCGWLDGNGSEIWVVLLLCRLFSSFEQISFSQLRIRFCIDICETAWNFLSLKWDLGFDAVLGFNTSSFKEIFFSQLRTLILNDDVMRLEEILVSTVRLWLWRALVRVSPQVLGGSVSLMFVFFLSNENSVLEEVVWNGLYVVEGFLSHKWDVV